jgi:hypothetical protein
MVESSSAIGLVRSGQTTSGASAWPVSRELGRELARRDLGEGEVVNDLADRPVLLARPPVSLALREAFSFLEDLGAHRLELGPQRVDGLGKRHGVEYTSVPRADRACYSPGAARRREVVAS